MQFEIRVSTSVQITSTSAITDQELAAGGSGSAIRSPQENCQLTLNSISEKYRKFAAE